MLVLGPLAAGQGPVEMAHPAVVMGPGPGIPSSWRLMQPTSGEVASQAHGRAGSQSHVQQDFL